MLNANFVILLFFLWVLGFRPVQAFCERIEVGISGARSEMREVNRAIRRNFWVYCAVGGMLFGLGVAVWLVG